MERLLGFQVRPQTGRLIAKIKSYTLADLIADMNAANAAGGSNTIALTPGSTFKLNAVDNNAGGPNGLPVIAAGDDLTILGNGDTLQRSAAKSTPAFRLFYVVGGGSLSLSGLTLSNGMASVQSQGYGGAIANLGTLTLDGVTIQGCTAQAQNGDSAYGGGIFSYGVLTIANSVIQNNQALGGNAFNLSGDVAGVGRSAFGGGIYVSGSASLTNTTISSNLARGGDGQKGYSLNGGKFGFPIVVRGGSGGDASGGGISVGAGTLELLGTTITQNTATGGMGGNSPKGFPAGANGIGKGGGLYIYPSALASLDSFTQVHTTGNTASTSDNDIFGSFSLLP